MKYQSWIPTLTGKLSHKLIGKSKFPSVPSFQYSVIKSEVEDKTVSYLYVNQNRWTGDEATRIPKWMASLYPSMVYFDFVLLAKSSKSSDEFDPELLGNVFILPMPAPEDIKKKLKALYTTMGEVNFSRKPSDPNELVDNFENLSIILSDHSLYRAGIELECDGVVRIENLIVNEKHVNIDESKKIIQEFEGDYHSLNHWIANQTFYFLRDISHEHRYHEPWQDNIIETQIVDEDCINSPKWYIEVINSLHDTLNIERRSSKEDSRANSLGLLAYIESFQNIAKRRLGETEYKKVFKNVVHTDIASSGVRENSLRQNQRFGNFINSDRQYMIFSSYILIATFAVFLLSFDTNQSHKLTIDSQFTNLLIESTYKYSEFLIIIFLFLFGALIAQFLTQKTRIPYIIERLHLHLKIIFSDSSSIFYILVMFFFLFLSYKLLLLLFIPLKYFFYVAQQVAAPFVKETLQPIWGNISGF